MSNKTQNTVPTVAETWPFITKLNMEGGYRISSFGQLNRDLITTERWGVDQILNRTKRLAELFLQVWKYPDVQTDGVTSYAEVDIFDADDPTFKKLEYSVFNGERLNIRNVVDLYTEVIKRLFALRPEQFADTPLADRIGLTYTKPTPGTGQYAQIADSCYCNKGVDNRTKFEWIKEALIACDLEGALIIKYGP